MRIWLIEHEICKDNINAVSSYVCTYTQFPVPFAYSISCMQERYVLASYYILVGGRVSHINKMVNVLITLVAQTT